jgi:hypothetical protein
LLFLGITKIPGTTVFTRMNNGALADIRFETSEASKKYKTVIAGFPSNIKERSNYENAQWYKIYIRHKDDASVCSVHRDFLLCRDLYTTTISMTILTGMMMIVQLISFSWILLGYLLLMLIITNCVAHNKAHRFVNTVIAVDVAQEGK